MSNLRPSSPGRSRPDDPVTRPRERMLDRVSATTRTVDVGGSATAIIELGEGPPLLLLHGGIECGAAMWAPVLNRLGQHHRVVAPDVPGLGDSAPVARLDVDAFGAWLTGVVEGIGPERPAVVAHSLVGSLVARCAARDRGRFGALIIYAAPGVGPYWMPMRLRYVATRFALRPTERNAHRFERFALLDVDATRRRDPAWYDAFDAFTRARAGDAQVARAMRQLVAEGTTRIPDRELDRIDIPTALLWGRHDRMVPLTVARAASTRHGWPLHVIDGAAHAPHVEQPDAFVEALLAITIR